VGKIIFGIMLMAFVVAMTVYYTTWARIMDAFYQLADVARQYAPLFISTNFSLIILLVVFMLVAAVLAVFISHKIAGPMFRFERSLEAIANGDLHFQVNLRKSDEFKYLADKVNTMILQLRSKIQTEQTGIMEINELMTQLQALEKTKGKKQQLINKVATRVGALKSHMQDGFKLS
jgi:methyl-accepting chemotaxis protein